MFFVGLLAGGPAAVWYIYIQTSIQHIVDIYINRSTFLITVIFMLTSAAVVTEICSALPSIYI